MPGTVSTGALGLTAGAPLLSVHRHLIAQPPGTYPLLREKGGVTDAQRYRVTRTKMAAIGERPATDRDWMRRASAGGRGANSGGPRADLGLPHLAAVREPQSREYRCERRLFWVG